MGAVGGLYALGRRAAPPVQSSASPTIADLIGGYATGAGAAVSDAYNGARNYVTTHTPQQAFSDAKSAGTRALVANYLAQVQLAQRPHPVSDVLSSLNPLPAAQRAYSLLQQAQSTGQRSDWKAATLAGVGALAAITPAGAEEGGMIRGAARAAGTDIAGAAERAAPIVAYHGSPHTFDAFDASKIGTGEGAQAYGHGLYFAENEGTAKAYRDALALPSNPQNDATRYWLGQAGNDKVKASQMFTDYAASTGMKPEDVTQAAQQISGAPGSMYQVGINANPDHFLDWDKPLSEQHPVVQGALNKAADSLRPGFQMPLDDRRGSSGYMDLGLLSKRPASEMQDAATQALQDAGIPGIKYLDAGSRGAGDGTRNYVVFDPANIDIMKRYGIAATALGGAGMAAASQAPAPDPNAPNS
jgi:hypothetical protein